MLALFFGNTAKALQQILQAFCPPPARILDTTCGENRSWKGVQLSTLFGDYKLVKMDKRKLSKIDIIGDFRYLPFKENSFDCIYFDPPYCFSDVAQGYDFKNLSREEAQWTTKEFYDSVEKLSAEVPRVLRVGGTFIAKVMDFYWEDSYFPVAFEVFSKFSLLPKATFIVPIQRSHLAGKTLIRANFIYYLVFKQVLDQAESKSRGVKQ